MALHMTIQTAYGAEETAVDLQSLAVCRPKLRVAYNAPATLTFTLYASNLSMPLGTGHFIKFWDDEGPNPYVGGTQSETNPLFEGFLEAPQPGDDGITVNYTAHDPTRKATTDISVENLGWLNTDPPVRHPGAVPRNVYNVTIDNDDDYAHSLLIRATMGQIIRDILDEQTPPMRRVYAAPASGIPYTMTDLAALTFQPQEKQVFESDSIRSAVERMLRQWEPAWRLLWYPGSRKWRFGDITQSATQTFTINEFGGTYKLLSLHLNRSLDDRATAIEFVGPETLIEVNATQSGGGLTLLPNTEPAYLQTDIATCCTVEIQRRWQITDPLLRKVARRLQLPVDVNLSDYYIETAFYPTFLVYYPNNTDAGNAGWRAVSGWSLDARSGIITFGTQGVYRYNSDPAAGQPNYETPTDAKFIYATYADPISVRYPTTGFSGTAYDVANVQICKRIYDPMLAVGYERNQPVTTEFRRAKFLVLARRMHAQKCDIIYTGGGVLDGLQYAFAALDRRINFDAVDEDGDPVDVDLDAINAVLTDVEYDFAEQITTFTISSDQQELMRLNVDQEKERLKIVALERHDWTQVSMSTTIRPRTISDPMGGFSSMNSVHETRVNVDKGHYYYDPKTGEQG